MNRYWVVGGEYETTDFRRIANGKPEERHGPFASLAEARRKWAGLAMSTVDNAHMRFRIEEEDATKYWVVGGRYADATFTAPAGAEERLGPFAEREALETWRRKAIETEDDALARYRIERT